MPQHVHTGPGEYDYTASAFIVRLDTPEPSLMLHRHKALDILLQFGGHELLTEDIWKATGRELEEETGYTISDLQLLQPPHTLRHLSGIALHPTPVYLLSHPFPGIDHNHTDIAFAFTATGPPSHAVAEGESKDIQLVTEAELAALAPEDIPENVRETGQFILSVVLKHWESFDASTWNTSRKH